MLSLTLDVLKDKTGVFGPGLEPPVLSPLALRLESLLTSLTGEGLELPSMGSVSNQHCYKGFPFKEKIEKHKSSLHRHRGQLCGGLGGSSLQYFGSGAHPATSSHPQ